MWTNTQTQRNALLLGSDATGVAKTIIMQDCHKTSKKINEIGYQSDYDNDIQFDTIDTSGWDGERQNTFPLTLLVKMFHS